MRTVTRAMMAKAKGKKAAPKPEGPGAAGSKKMIAGLKAGPEFEAWLHRFAKAQRDTLSALIEKALIAYAKAEGFNEEPPER